MQLMKIYKSLILSCAVLLGVCACTEDPIEVFGYDNYLHFTQESKKAYRFSFATVPGEAEYEYEIPMTLIGRALDVDKEYKLDLVTEGDIVTTATTASYQLPEKLYFGKGKFEDVLKIKFIDNAELNEEKVLVLSVAENENFKKGPVDHQTAVIYLSNYLVQPDWWSDDMETVFLGDYSDIKYEHFILATGISDMTDMSAEKVKSYVTTFVYYLWALDEKGQTVYEADGQTKVVDSIPYSKNL